MKKDFLYMKKFKIAVKPICFILIFCLLNKLFSFLAVDDTDSFTRIMMHEFYHPDSNIDVLFLGASHCYRSLDTKITDELFQCNTFNAGSSSQSADGTYALLCEAVKNNKIGEVFVEVSFITPQYEAKYQDRKQMTGTYIISDYMKPSYNKFQFLLHASSAGHYGNSFFPARRNWEQFFHPAGMASLLKKKLSKEYREFNYITTQNERYCGKGFVEDDTEIPIGGFYSMEEYQKIEDTTWSEDWQGSIQQVISLCEEKGIPLVFYSAPMPDFLLAASGDYDKYIQFMDSLLQGTSAKYYDFNLCKPQYLSLNESDFKDDNHLNTMGAKIFSRLFSEFFTGSLAGEDIFYHSWQEKKASQEDKIYGLIVKDNKEKNCVSISAVTNKESVEGIAYTAERVGTSGRIFTERKDIQHPLPYKAGETGMVAIKVWLDGKETNHISVPYGAE